VQIWNVLQDKSKTGAQMNELMLCLTSLAVMLSAATVLLKRVTGVAGGPTLTDITNTVPPFTLNTADVTFDGTAHPIQVPSSGTNYSYWASLCAVCSVAPATAINNMAVYSDGSDSLGTGIGANIGTVSGTNGSITTNYVQATGTPGVTGTQLTSGAYAGLTGPANYFGYTSSAPLSITGTFTTGVDTASNSAAGRFGDWFILQLTVGTNGVTGVTPSEPLTLVWDEF
jgi:hypothetical protein